MEQDLDRVTYEDIELTPDTRMIEQTRYFQFWWKPAGVSTATATILCNTQAEAIEVYAQLLNDKALNLCGNIEVAAYWRLVPADSVADVLSLVHPGS